MNFCFICVFCNWEALQVHIVLYCRLFLPPSLHLSVFPALAAEGGMVMFNACGLCCTQRWRMGSSPLISNKRSLETRQAQHRSTSSKVWSDVDTDVCPGPSTVCSWAPQRLFSHNVYNTGHSLPSITYWGCQYRCLLVNANTYMEWMAQEEKVIIIGSVKL